ncbi:hypothetical protein OIU77_022960 [Salix suchowensis]|uniref:Uncharacterized protein n=1 Tax=Salix suchowensis TaxID=1278906 RepID=A0ABQ9C255_9ROSI|nr:hypothetical protein OIU77_022960 [Salix suchowensis]
MIWYRWFSLAPCGPARAQRFEQAYEKEFVELATFFSRKTATSILEVWVSVASIVRGAERTWTFSRPHMRSPNSISEYSFICNGTFLHHLIVNNIAPADTIISNILGGSVKLFSPKSGPFCFSFSLCSKTRGNVGFSFVSVVVFGVVDFIFWVFDAEFDGCDHEQMKNAEGCIVEIIGEINLDHFFVGTQDTDMQKKFQEANGRLRFKPVLKSVNASSKDCSKMVILHASNNNKTQRLLDLKHWRMIIQGLKQEKQLDDDEASLEDDVYIQKKQKDTKHKTRQVKHLRMLGKPQEISLSSYMRYEWKR